MLDQIALLIAQQSGGRVSRLGERTADLLSDVLGPIVIVMVAVAGLYAFIRREIAVAVSAAMIALFLGLFVFAPQTAQSLIEGFWRQIT